MFKKLLFVIGLSSLSFAAEKTYLAANTEKDKFAEVDAYIASFNEIFQLADKNQEKPALILQKAELQMLSEADKKWFLAKMVNSPGSYLKLVRAGAQVSLVHNKLHITIAKFDVGNFAETGFVSFNGRDVNLRAILAETNLKKQSAMFLAEINRELEAKKTAARRIVEKVLLVVTLPFRVLTACTEGGDGGVWPPTGSDAAKAAAAGHTFTQRARPPEWVGTNSPRTGGFVVPGSHICYDCTDSYTYNRFGSREPKPLFGN